MLLNKLHSNKKRKLNWVIYYIIKTLKKNILQKLMQHMLKGQRVDGRSCRTDFFISSDPDMKNWVTELQNQKPEDTF